MGKKWLVVMIISLGIYLLGAGRVNAAVSLGTGNSKATGISPYVNLLKSSNGTLVAFWAGTSQIWGVKSTDGGLTWTKLDGSPGVTSVVDAGPFPPSAIIDSSDNIILVINSGIVCYSVTLTYSGGNWVAGTPAIVSLLCVGNNANLVKIPSGRMYAGAALSSGSVVIRYSDDGAVWTASLVTGVSTVQDAPKMLLYNNNAAIFYYNGSDLTWRKSDGSPTTWTAPSTILTASAENKPFTAVASGNIIYLIYADGGIKIRKYDGVSWDAADTILSVGVNDTDPKLILKNDGYPLAVWSKYNSATDRALVYKALDADGWDSSEATIINDGNNNRYFSGLSGLSSLTVPYTWTSGNNPYTVYFDTFDLPGALTPTPTPTSTSTPGSSGFSSPGAPSCGERTGSGTPDLFEIRTKRNEAELFFVASEPPYNSYYVSYSTSAKAEEFGAEFRVEHSGGVLKQLIGSLNSGTIYYFKVRMGNGCSTGQWSKVVEARTSAGNLNTKVRSANEPVKTTPTMMLPEEITPTPIVEATSSSTPVEQKQEIAGTIITNDRSRRVCFFRWCWKIKLPFLWGD